MKLGIIYDESLTEYHKADAFSASRLKVFRRLPALYKAMFIDKTVPQKPKTRALDVGSALDCLLLHGVEKYNDQVVVHPAQYGPSSKPWSWNANECKAWGAANAGKIILSPDDASLVEEMSQAAFRNPDFAALLENGKPGVTFRFDYGFAVAQCQCDWLNLEGTILPSTGEKTGPYWLELKSAASLNKSDFYGFRDSYVDQDYYLQTPLYQEIIRDVLAATPGGTHGTELARVGVPRPFFGVVDKTEIPFAQIFDPLSTSRGREHFELTRDKVLRDVERLAECHRTGVWPGLPTGIQPLELPKWREKQLLEEIA
jgi:hypothetical protein